VRFVRGGVNIVLASSLTHAATLSDHNFHVIILPGEQGVENYGPRSASRWAKLEAAMASVVSRGVGSFKLFMSYKGLLMLDDRELIAGLAKARDLGAVPLFHAENGHAAKHGRDRVYAKGIIGPEGDALARPPELEGEAVRRIALYASMLDAPAYIVHVMSKDAMDEITAARERGVRMVGEAIVASISVPHDGMWDPDYDTAAKFTLSPPLRSRKHVEALARGLATGRLHLVGSDHAAFNTTQKRLGLTDFRETPVSGNGIEERLTVTYDVLVNSGLATPSDVVRVCSTEAAQTFNLYPRKGVIQVGSDADVVVFDPRERQVLSAKTHHSRIDTSLWEGREVTGKVVLTISRGRIVYKDGAITAQPGTGRFVPAPPFGKLYQGLDTYARVKDEVNYPASVYGAVPVERTASDATASQGKQEL
jgi:dihydropyrimidinase